MSHSKWNILTFTILLEILKVRTCIGVFDYFLFENPHFLIDVLTIRPTLAIIFIKLLVVGAICVGGWVKSN